MAATKNMTDIKLLDAGKAVAGLLSTSLAGMRLVNTYDLTDAG